MSLAYSLARISQVRKIDDKVGSNVAPWANEPVDLISVARRRTYVAM